MPISDDLPYYADFYNVAGISSSDLSAIITAYQFTSEKLEKLRKVLEQKLESLPGNDKFCIVAVGSYGRYEASNESDLDVYFVGDGEVDFDMLRDFVREATDMFDVKLSKGFEDIQVRIMLKHIGGNDDTNRSITNRILFLTESVCLYNDGFYERVYGLILMKYLRGLPGRNKRVPRFLLNDVIRYYRTMCVDYEFKTTEENKDWAIRNIKLRFSRKGLYWGGVAILLNSVGKESMREYITRHLRLPFVEKVAHILVDHSKISEHKELLILYAYFLDQLSSNNIREYLKKLKIDNRGTDDKFRELTNKSIMLNKHFSQLLKSDVWGIADHLDYILL